METCELAVPNAIECSRLPPNAIESTDNPEMTESFATAEFA